MLPCSSPLSCLVRAPVLFKMASTVHNWANLDYLAERLGRNKSYLAEYSATNHFMYYSRRGNGII